MMNTITMRLQLAAQRALGRLGYGITNYRDPSRSKRWDLSTKTPRRIATATTPLECMQLYEIAAACEIVPGALAEAGVFRGGTAAILLQASSKELHLFDTFEGLPQSEGGFEQGEYAGSIQQVQTNLRQWNSRIHFHPGLIPESTVGLDDLRFAMVHLDLDLYEGTRAALTWFWPRLNPGGVLVSHDYPNSTGVVQAFREYFVPRQVVVLPLAGHQCLVAKS